MLFVGHRGAPVHKVENSLESFDYALKNDLGGIELDLRVSKDGVVVVFHDETMERLTTLKGQVKNYEFLDIQRIFLKGKYRIPLFSDVFYRVKTLNKDVKIFLEIKDAEAVEPLGNFLRGKDISNIVILSFDTKDLISISEMIPNISVGLNSLERKIDNIILEIGSLLKRDLNLEYINLEYQNITQGFLKELRKKNQEIKTGCFTIDDEERFQKMMSYDLDLAFIGDPHLVETNYFALFELKQSYGINLEELEKNYKKLQKKYDPANSLKDDFASEKPFLINKAYETLKDPLERSVYLLKLNDIMVREEQRWNKPTGEMLLSIKENRKKIANALDQEELKEMRSMAMLEFGLLVKELEENFKNADYHKATDVTIQLKFLNRFLNEIRNKRLYL